MRPNIQFWFDFSCPFAFLGSLGIEALAERTGATLDIKPMLLGGVFRELGVPQNLASSLSAEKARHNADDMRRWAAIVDSPLEIPAAHPIRTVDALRSLLAVGEPFGPLMHAFYRAYWIDGVDVSSEAGLHAVLKGAGHDPDEVLRAARTDAVKQELRDRTDQAIAAGVFGAPALVVDGSLYWGQDSYAEVERMLGGAPAALLHASATTEQAAPVDFYFDFASPYCHLAVHEAEALLGDSVRFVPVLMGAIWKQVNPAALSFATATGPKSDYLGADYRRRARHAGLRAHWPSTFPTRTMLALRVTLLAGDGPTGRRLMRALFEAYWSDNRDISSPEVVGAVCNAVGLDGADLLARAGSDEAKAGLRKNTSAAVEAGVFGLPAFVVHSADRDPALFWGHDRLELATRAARGDASLL